MSRYIRNEAIGKPADFVDFIMSDFIQKHGFTLVKINGEMMYQKGKGLLEMPQYFSYRYMNGVLHIEAWVKFAWLPGVYGKENDMSGFVGSIPKSAYKEDIEELIRVLYQPLPGEQQNPYGGYGQPMQGGMQNGYGQPAANGPIMVKGVDMKKRAKMGFGMSIVGGIFLALALFISRLDESGFDSSLTMIWVAGMLYAALGTGYSYRGMSSSKSGLATAGFAIGVIELIAGFLLLVMGIL